MTFFDFMMSYYGYETKAEIILVIIFGIIGILFSEFIIYYGIGCIIDIMDKKDKKDNNKNEKIQEDQNDFFIEGIEDLEDINISSLSKEES